MLARNPEAQQLHNAGLQAESNGDYPAVHASFADAKSILADLPTTLVIRVQSARIDRGDGFTFIREGIAALPNQASALGFLRQPM